MKKKKIFYLILFAFLIGILTSYICYSKFIDVKQTTEKNVQEKNVAISVNELMVQAKEAYYKGDLLKSRQNYKTVLKKRPDYLNALKNLIHVNKELGNYKEVLKSYNQLISYNPENLNWKYELGITHYQIGNYKKAEKILKEINNKLDIEANSKFNNQNITFLYYYLGKTFEKEGKFNKALTYFEKGIKNNSSISLNYIGKGKIYLQKNNFKEAINAYKKALKVDYSLITLYPELARSYETIEKYEKAYHYWQKCVDIGIESDLASQKIKHLENKYSYLKEKEEKDEEGKRVDIDWAETESLTDISNIPEIRVGLLDHISKFTFQVKDAFKVLDKESKNIILNGKPQQEWKIKYYQDNYFFYRQGELVKQISGTKSLIIKPLVQDATIVIYNVSFGSGYFWAGSEDRQYRGKIQLLPVTKADNFSVINILNLEEYLLSVVPAEMPAWWPEEALKAQSIAARSYALENMGRHSDEGYDLCSSVHCAVYKGVNSENEKTNRAVLATRGKVATYENKIINAVFSSNSGGYSESSQDVWGTQVPYLSGANNMVEMEANFPLSPHKLEDWLKHQPPSYSKHHYTGNNSYRWIKLLPASYFVDKFNLEVLKNVIPGQRSQGGSVETIVLKGKNKTITVERDNIRSALGGLRSNRFIIKKIYDNKGKITNLIIQGGGWGHNVGLDQTAAAGMASREFNYKEIIFHFYKGTKIKKIY